MDEFDSFAHRIAICMTKASRIEHIYQDIKQVLLKMPMRPGQRIDVEALAAHYGVSNVPIRMLMNRLVGEAILEVVPHEGYAIPPATAQQVRDLHKWNQNTLLLALEELFDTETTPDMPPVPIGDDDVVRDTERLFSAIADLSDNRESGRTVRNLNDRLRSIRQINLTDLIDAPKELSVLAKAWAQKDLFGLHKLIWQYHRRRLDLLPEILMRAYSRPRSPAP